MTASCVFRTRCPLLTSSVGSSRVLAIHAHSPTEKGIMQAFLDESGDAGLKVTGGSSALFVVALVVFEENEEAQAVTDRIAQLRRDLRLTDDYEFKFHSSRRDFRTRFLQTVAPYSFFYHGIAINKAKLQGKGFQHKESFYKYASGLVFENAKFSLNDASVVIDGSGSREFRRELQNYLMRRINDSGPRFIRRVQLKDSAHESLLQLADMIAGAVHRSLGTKADRDDYRDLVSHREMRVQVWPK